MIELAFAALVVIAMPLRAWRRRRAGAPRRFDRYLIETLALIATLSWLLWRRGTPARAIGLTVDSWLVFALHTVICLIVVAGPDAWAAWRISTSPARGVAAEPDPIFADVHAGRHAKSTFLAAMIVGAIWEELCFRATIMLLVPWTSLGLALGIAGGSLLFGAQHLRSGARRAAYACVYGVIFSVLYVTTRNLTAVIVAHAAGNILSGLQWTPRLERVRQRPETAPPIFLG